MKSLLSLVTVLLLSTSQAFAAVDSLALESKLVGLFYQDISEGYIISFQNPDYIDSYLDSDDTKIHLFKALLTLPIYGNSGGFDLGGNEETTEPAIGQETKCEYIKYVEEEDDFTYAGPCTLKLEFVTDGALYDEGLIDEN